MFGMWWGLVAPAAEPVAQSWAEAAYLNDTFRTEAARDFYAARLAEDPAHPAALVRYLETLTYAPRLRTRALPALVDDFAAQHDLPTRGAAKAVAVRLAAMHPDILTLGLWFDAGPWCEPALAALAEVPEPPRARALVLEARLSVGRVCNVDEPALLADQSAWRAIAATGALGPVDQARFSYLDGIDDADLTTIEAAFTEEPSRIDRLGPWFGDDLDDSRLDEARRLLTSRAEALLVHDEAAVVHAALALLRRADPHTPRLEARRHLKKLDPDNQSNVGMLERAERSDAVDDEVIDPTQLHDPAERLAGLVAAGPPSTHYSRKAYWTAYAEAAEATGDHEAWLTAARWLDQHGSVDGTLTYVRATVTLGTQTHRALRRAEHRVQTTRRNTSRASMRPDDAALWREDLAMALHARALAKMAKGQRKGALADWRESLALVPGEPERLVRAGLLAEPTDYVDRQFLMLLQGLAGEPALPEEVASEAWRIVEDVVNQRFAWASSSPAAFVEAWRTDGPRPALARPLDGSAFADLKVEIDGARQRLLDLPGPLVVDVWATWCSPCVASLPHLGTLADRYDGRVTMVALSVDDERETATQHLAARGTPRFTPAWAGKDAMKNLGIQGIPATFVFDAEHRLVAEIKGFSAGDRRLDRAIERMLQER